MSVSASAGSFNLSHNQRGKKKRFDDGRADYEIEEGELEPNITKIIVFLRHNELHLVTEYNHKDASQIFGSGIVVHLLLLVSKRSEQYQPLLEKFRGVAPEFRGKVIFILVDTDVKGNNRVISYFKVKQADLPAICIFDLVTDTVDVMPASDFTPESVRKFCHNFMEGKGKSAVKPAKPSSEEL
uniref:endoplasmic reticulum resident protein 27-like n=1 Tax=Pristiophorus japonicus TaxID=55135 RepID=UPI00398E3FA7